MKVKKDFAGWYYISLKDGRRFELANTGGREYPWNLSEWSSLWNCYDWSDQLAFSTKREAIEHLKGMEE